VDPSTNRAERSLRFAVMWRKGSSGTDREAGNRWVEWALSLRQTCRQLGQSTFGVLVDAVTSFCQGRQPELAWLYLNARHASPFTLSSRTQETTDAMVKTGSTFAASGSGQDVVEPRMGRCVQTVLSRH
jgi:hypothetical protein